MINSGQIVQWRFIAVASCLVALPLLLVWHLANLQVIPGQEKDYRFLQNAGEARTLRRETINAYRGIVTDRNGELLAVSTPVKSLFVNPQKIDATEIPRLAAALSISKQELSQRLERYRLKQFMYLARHMPPHEAEQVLKHRFKGVYAQEEFQRFYPAGEVAAHLVGFTDINDHGQEGLELGYDTWLAGMQGSKYLIKDLKGNVVRDLGMDKSPRSGSDLRLTIDLRLQYIAHKELKAHIAKHRAKSGSVVIMDAQGGDILAVVNHPSYNPNNRSRVDPDRLRNRAFTDVFEPGSTMKPFTVMAALETGRYSVSHTIDTSPGHIFVTGKMIPDPVNYGVLDLTGIIAKSSQVGISKLALEMQPEDVRDMYFRVGLGQSSGAGFPGESIGTLPNRARWRPIEQATFSYGYGLSVNAVQLAQAYSVISSGGKFVPARVIANASAPQGLQVIDPGITKKMTAMLKSVVSPKGTGAGAQLESYTLAGKTGTAHKVGGQGYADDKYVALFAGFAPADEPKIVVVVIVNEPPAEGVYSGGKVAAPLFANVSEKVLKVLRVPPEKNSEQIYVAVNNKLTSDVLR